jgi:adenylosuccinate synthase
MLKMSLISISQLLKYNIPNGKIHRQQIRLRILNEPKPLRLIINQYPRNSRKHHRTIAQIDPSRKEALLSHAQKQQNRLQKMVASINKQIL